MTETPSPDEQHPRPFAVFDGALDSIVVLSAARDANGRFVEFRIAYANPAALDVGGRNVADFVGGRVVDHFPALSDSRLHRRYLEVLETGQSIGFPAREYTETIDGQKLTGWYRLQASRFGDNVVLAYRDITAEHDQEMERAAERAEAALLQDALLPRVLPLDAGLELAAAYLPARDAAMGGDWYDAFPVDGGLCLVVGDVAGHGLQAAAVMIALRNAVRAFADEDPAPGRVLSRLNRMLCRLEPGEAATAVVAVWDAAAGTIVWSTAGHPPPLRCRAGETGFLSPAQVGVMLGAEPDWVYTTNTKVLRPGTTLLFYSDGLVETRGRSLDEGMDDLRLLAEGLGDLSPQAVCDQVLEWRLGAARQDDDMCLLAARTG
jgi:serine phosphatase RsbU (regulator of sigma subunit)